MLKIKEAFLKREKANDFINIIYIESMLIQKHYYAHQIIN